MQWWTYRNTRPSRSWAFARAGTRRRSSDAVRWQSEQLGDRVGGNGGPEQLVMGAAGRALRISSRCCDDERHRPLPLPDADEPALPVRRGRAEARKLGVEHRTERVPQRRSRRPEIEELTGQRRVPVLVDGNEVVHDSKRIVQYLEWKHGRESFWIASPLGYAM